MTDDAITGPAFNNPASVQVFKVEALSHGVASRAVKAALEEYEADGWTLDNVRVHREDGAEVTFGRIYMLAPEEHEQEADFAAMRRALGWTQAECAERLGLTRKNTVSEWERGKAPVPGPVSLLMQAYADGWRPTPPGALRYADIGNMPMAYCTKCDRCAVFISGGL